MEIEDAVPSAVDDDDPNVPPLEQGTPCDHVEYEVVLVEHLLEKTSIIPPLLALGLPEWPGQWTWCQITSLRPL